MNTTGGIETVLADALRSHVGVGTDPVRHPYKARCRCGEWCYDMEAHRSRVGAAALTAHILSEAVVEAAAQAAWDLDMDQPTRIRAALAAAVGGDTE